MLYEASGMWDITSTHEYSDIEGYVMRREFGKCGIIVEYIESIKHVKLYVKAMT